MTKEEVISYLKNFAVVIITVILAIYPVLFLTSTNDPFIFPKQLLVVSTTGLLLLLFGAKSILERKITIKTTPYNLPLVLFGVVILISSVISKNMFDSLLATIPLVALLFFYFMMTNMIEEKQSFRMIIVSLLVGGILLSLFSILQYFKVYIFPFALTRDQLFNPHGSLLQVLIYLTPLIAYSAYSMYQSLKHTKDLASDLLFFFHIASTVIMGLAFLLGIYQIIALPQKPIILPFIYGFQIALASISQDTSRLVASFLFGSGYGTFTSDFTRFKLPSFNLERDIWNLVFSYSSSYYLELVATTGLLGAITYLFLAYKFIKTKAVRTNGMFFALALILFLSFILPLSFSTIFILLVMFSFYSLTLYFEKRPQVHNVTISLVAFREGLFNVTPESSRHAERQDSYVLPGVVFSIIILIVGVVGFYMVKVYASDVKFRDSFDPANLNNGGRVYELQAKGINDFPYKADYHRVFSQINFALANSLISNIPQGSSPSADIQRQVFLLLQQSINEGRNAAILSPMTAVNWQNLSQIYRNLINVGQNAEQFAVASLQQAILLDSANPQLYIELGGIFYQLGQFENAQNQFGQAIRLKPDFANAYYNYGHALEAKNTPADLANAINYYRQVRQLVSDNQESVAKINGEIEALESRLAAGQTGEPTTQVESQTQQPPLQISSPSATLPPQKPPVEIPPPPTASESGR